MKRYMSYINKLEKINQKLESSLLDSQIKGSGFIIWGFISAFILLFGCHLFFKEFITWTSNKHGRSDFIAFAVDAGLLCKHMFNVMLCMQFVFLVCAVNVTLRTQNDRLRNLIFELKLYGRIV
ncbi:uncharacterized protein LOC124533028 [Vanessa cardui]|uniref:uncharacterized protein LOC124533028 n=1 Tax=Vanessa cardui TaxID=171605 RepID=UPI001F13F0AA|nr:uncharacterized protein LOC124533028 [Vanessa cardui]